MKIQRSLLTKQTKLTSCEMIFIQLPFLGMYIGRKQEKEMKSKSMMMFLKPNKNYLLIHSQDDLES